MPRPVEPGRWRPLHQTAEYRALRRRILDAYGWRCDCCGCAGRLELHHRDGDRNNNAANNLQPLCRPCHCIVDGRRPGPDRSVWRAEIERRLAE